MDEAMALLWGEKPGQKRGPRPAFTPAEIAATGIAVADAEGLAAVTMQRVAAALGVTKMALYRYVPGKAELVALMVDQVMAAPPTEPHGHWRQELDAWARTLFAKFQAHPWTIEATVGRRPTGPNEVAWLERAVAALRGTGLTGPEILDTAVLLTGHVRSLAQQTATAPTEADFTAGLFTLVGRHEERFPALAELIRNPQPGQNDALGFGLARILDGVATYLARKNGAPSTVEDAPAENVRR